MEAVPRMPMLSFDLKHSPEYVEFAPVLKQYIRDHYGEDPANYNKACNDLEQLRQSAVHVSHDFMGCSTLKKYYAQLQFLSSRFPVGEGGEAVIPFTWEEVHTAREITLADVKFEQACILYNIGSLHSILGAMDTRQTADGMKVSCTHFQCSAWAYEHLRDHFGSSSMSMDMAHELLTFQVTLTLVQAQECILEKSMIDSRKSTITAKVSAQTVEYYRTALKHLDTCEREGLIGSRKYKDWKRRIEIKILFYQCITSFYQGLQSETQQKWGESVAYYTLSHDKLLDCTKMAKNEVSEIQEALRFTNDVVAGKLQAMKKDNDFVYHDKVPAADTLAEVKGASLVKGIPFNPNDNEISGQDIFHKLVPMEAHEAASLYSEEKAKLIRKIGASIEEKNSQLTQYMSSLQLDPSKLSYAPQKLPQELLEKCAAVSVRTNAIKDLVDSMGAVSSIAIEVDMGIKEIFLLLDNEQTSEEEFQRMFGKRSLNVVLSEIRKECALYDEGHQKGSQSNNDLHKAMNTHITNLRLLGGPLEDLQKALPSLEQEKSPENEAIVAELKRLISKVEEMKKQRADLEAELRASVHSDDITNVIVTRETPNKEALFQDQLTKHSKQIEIIEKNLAAQDNILHALTDANAQYADIRRKTKDINARRDAMVRDLMNSYDVYEDLLAKSQKGQEFYRKLETNVNRLLERTQRLCKTQQDERDQITNRYKPKEPPPSRPMAPKPTPGMVASEPSPPGLASFEGPKLKDYLPFMKPATFGPKAGQKGMNVSSGSLPNSNNVSPVHIPSSSVSHPGTPEQGRREVPDRQIGVNTSLQPQFYPHSPQPQSLSPQPQQFPQSRIPQPQTPEQAHSPKPPAIQPQSSQPQQFVHPNTSQPHLQTHRPQSPQQHSPQVYSGHPQQPLPQPVTQFQTSQPSHFSPQPTQYKPQPPIPPVSGSQRAAMQQYIPASQEAAQIRYSQTYAVPSDSPATQVYPSSSQNPVLQGYPGHQPTYLVQPQSHQIQKPNQHQVAAPPQPSLPPQPAVPTSGYPMSSQVSPSRMGPSQPPTQVSTQDPSLYTRENFPQQSLPTQPANQNLSQGLSAFQPVTSNVPITGPTLSGVPPIPVSNQVAQGRYDITNTVSAITTPIISPTKEAQLQDQGHAGVQTQGHAGVQGYSQAQQPFPSQLPPQSYALQPSSQSSVQQPHTGQGLAGTGQDHTVPGQPSVSVGGARFSQDQNIYLQQQMQGQIPIVSQSQAPGVQQPLPQQQLPRQPEPQQQLTNQQMLPGQQPQVSRGMVPQQQWPRHPIPTPQQTLQYSQISTQPQQNLPRQHFHQVPLQQQQQQQQQQLPGQQVSGQQQNFPSQTLLQQPEQQQLQNPQIRDTPTTDARSTVSNSAIARGMPNTAANTPWLPAGSQSSYPGSPAQLYNQQRFPGPHPLTGPSQTPQTAESQVRPPIPTYVQPGTQSQQFPGQTFPGQVSVPGTAQNGPQGFQGQSLNQHSQASNQPFSGQPMQPTQLSGNRSNSPLQSQQIQFQQQQIRSPQQPAQLAQQQMQLPQQQTQIPQQQTQLPQQQTQLPQQQTQLPQQQTQLPPQAQRPQQTHITQHQIRPQQQQQFVQQQAQFPQHQAQFVQQQAQFQQPNQLPQQPIQQPVVQQQWSVPSTNLPGQTAAQQHWIGQPGGPKQLPGQQMEPNLPPPLQPKQVAQMASGEEPAVAIVPSQAIPPADPNQANMRQSLPIQKDQAIPHTTDKHSVVTRQLSSTSTTSLDDILSTTKDNAGETTVNDVLRPKVLTAQEIQQQKEEALKGSVHVIKDPYTDKNVLEKFVAEVEKLSKFIETLCKPTCSGPSQLDSIWKELTEEQERWGRKHSIAVARCCPMKNRDPDIMPYDETRVVLTSQKDDYINASWVNDLSPSCPKFIAAQSPLPVTMTDFWMMVYEQGVEVLVMLSSEQETGKKLPVYWPDDKGETICHGPIVLTVQSVKVKQFWTERIIHLRHSEGKQARTVVHLLYNTWPVSGYPDKISHILQFIMEVHSFYRQQRSLLKPVLVHCSNGIGRTGAFILIYTGVQDINHGVGIANIPEVAASMLHRRRNLVRDRDQLKYCYDAIYYYAQDILAKQGILIHKEFGDKLPGPAEKQLQWTPTEDIVFGSVSLHSLQSSVSKLGSKHHEQHHITATETKLDKQIIQTDDLDDASVCSLPDVVQRTENSNATSKNSGTNQSRSNMDMLSGIDSPAEVRSRSNSSISNKSTGLGSGPASLEASPRHKINQDSVSSLPTSLVDLQNPNTFTLGSEEKAKRRITKASFSTNTSTLSETLSDPSDPFSSLDPLWKEKK
ncbi:hypothetical protein ScPMuIL_017058 [Solemya velum]